MPDRPVLLCFDGSEDAKHAISEAATLLGARPALVVTVAQDAKAIPPFAWVGASQGIEEVLAEAHEAAQRVADEGAQAAAAAGFDATARVIESADAVWAAIVDAAEHHDAAAIVIGSRGLSGVKSALLGSVSNAVVHHARRPTLVVPRT